MLQKKINLNLIVFELTESCNQKCKFCYNHWKGSEQFAPSKYSVTPDAKKTLKRLFKQARVNSISYSGGEPMLYSNIHDLILHSRFQKSNVSILTNGTMITDSDIETFHQLGVQKVQIPVLSSDSQIHDNLTQLPGSWLKAVENVKKILTIDPKWFNAVLVLTKQNIADIEKTLSFYGEIGVRSVLVNRFNIGGLGIHYREELELSQDDLKQTFSRINDFAQKQPIRFFSGVCTPMCILNPADYPYIGFSFCNKDVLHRPITINAKGEVRFCNHSPNILGNIFDKSLKDILCNESYDEYFNTVPTYCSSCSLIKLCQGGCRAASEQLYNTFAKADPLLDL